MVSTPPSTARLRSVSSMRRKKTPPLWWARRSLTMALNRLPRCIKPVGLGAMRVTFAPSGRLRGGYIASMSAGVVVISGKSRFARR